MVHGCADDRGRLRLSIRRKALMRYMWNGNYKTRADWLLTMETDDLMRKVLQDLKSQEPGTDSGLWQLPPSGYLPATWERRHVRPPRMGKAGTIPASLSPSEGESDPFARLGWCRVGHKIEDCSARILNRGEPNCQGILKWRAPGSRRKPRA